MKRAGWGWHSDGEDKVLPNAGSFIHALKLPPAEGDTLYADTYAANSDRKLSSGRGRTPSSAGAPFGSRITLSVFSSRT